MRNKVDSYQQTVSCKNTALSGIVFNIQRYSIHDGPGIRTIVFLSGCPLRCLWCSNPEGLDANPDLTQNARQQWKYRRMTVKEVLDDVAKDEAFYRRSGGGLTLSGGEPLLQADFCLALLQSAKQDYGFSTAIESSLYAPPEMVDKTLVYTDYLLADIKLMDAKKHKEYTGVDNTLILDNIRRIAASKTDLIIRFPLVPGINDDQENLNKMAEFLVSLAKPPALEILGYHEFGRGKYNSLGKTYPMTDITVSPNKEKMDFVENFLRDKGVLVVRT